MQSLCSLCSDVPSVPDTHALAYDYLRVVRSLSVVHFLCSQVELAKVQQLNTSDVSLGDVWQD